MTHMTRRLSRRDQPPAASAARRVGRRRGAAAFVLTAALAAGAACSHKAVEAVATDEDVPVAVQAATMVDTFDTTVATTGMVTPAAGADWMITAPEAARIAELPHGEGERVQVGDLLVRFEIPSMTADLASREADVTSAQARVDATKAAETRVAGLVTRGITAQKDLEAAQLDRKQAEASLGQAQAALNAATVLHERTTVRARFAGIIAKRLHAVGDLVDAGSPVVDVIDPNRLEVVAAIPVSDLSHVSPGQVARVEDPSGAATEAGSVVSIPAAVDPSSSTANVRVRFTAPTHLRTGTPVAVTIVTERLTNVLVIPAVGVVRDGDEVFVMVAGEDDDKAHKTPVTLGPTAGGRVQVKSGLKAGNLVIVRGQDGLPDEAGITIVK
jgi:RND family efflux transporter MFP subunit